MLRVGGYLLGSFILAGCATTARQPQDLPTKATQSAFEHAVPPGAPFAAQPIVSTNHPGVHRYHVGTPWRIAHFRPNLNMPEIIDADIVNNALTNEKAADLQRQLTLGKAVLWTFPRLVLLPCEEGCVGNKDYEKMAMRFLKPYDDMVRSGAGAYRGEMKIRVRWFRQKSFVERMNPLSFAQQAFGIEFPIEGNMLTLSASAFGKDASLEDCVDRVAGLFRMGVIFPMSLGLRNHFTMTLDPQYDAGVMERVNTAVASPVRGLNKLLGQTDYSSRVEPITAAHRALLPAIDGLQAGEGQDIGSGRLFDSF